MKHKQVLSILVVAGAWIAFNAGPTWTQTTPDPGTGQTEVKEGKGARTGEEKMEARGTQESGQMERKKGEEEMEARGAQKPGRMGKQGAEGMQAKESSQRWDKEDVRKVQEALKNKGHDPGSIDGVIGPQTRQAIRAFQGANGLKETASLNSETAKKLGVEREGAERGTSSRESSGMGKGQTSPMQKEPSSPADK